MLKNNQYPRRDFNLFLSLLLLYCFMCFTEIITFKLWPQVEEIWKEGYDELSITNNKLFLRFYLVFPIFSLSKNLGIDYNYLFTIIVPVMIFSSALNIAKVNYDVDELIKSKGRIKILTLSFLVLSGLSLFMNGRIVFAILGASMLLMVGYFWGSLKIVKLVVLSIVGLFLTSVSSGTFIVFALSLFILSFYHFLNDFSKRNVMLFCCSTILLLLISPLLKMYFFRNLDFYGGGFHGFINMLNHGFGALLFTENFYFLGFIVLLVMVFIFFFFFYFRNLRVCFIILSIALVGGLFGYSTMMIGIPPLVVLISYFFVRLYNFLYRKYAL